MSDLYQCHSNLIVDDFSVLDRVRQQQMEEFCNVCIARNVGLVASQQVIHPMLQTLLLSKVHNFLDYNNVHNLEE